ncbi:arginase [Paenibacillus aquistagni]|uniref:arginase n=1 Tax=Paenibacillus aquistagni TaxID=1852522 RepID=UPI00145A1CF2|nr:arginase [Paenibacillus aquistagni]NMM54024.1 arginase [Paenibacillus aquistagni]
MNPSLISLLRVPFGLGGARPGAELGPESLMDAGLIRQLAHLELPVLDDGVVDILSSAALDQPRNPQLKHLEAVIQLNAKLRDAVSDRVKKALFPLIIGGDHSIAIGTIAGLTKHYRKLGVIWFDAHGDLNTHETTPSGNIHGMSLAVSLNQGHPRLTGLRKGSYSIDPRHVVIIGARQLDQGERAFIRQSGITCFTMHEIDRYGIAAIMEKAIAIVSAGTDGVHLSFDIDSVDPYEAPGTGTAVRGGVTYREAHYALEALHEANILTSAEVVEVNPLLDHNKQTVKLANELICSLLGKRIL